MNAAIIVLNVRRESLCERERAFHAVQVWRKPDSYDCDETSMKAMNGGPAPLHANGHGQNEKKLRKRRQLDAMLAKKAKKKKNSLLAEAEEGENVAASAGEEETTESGSSDIGYGGLRSSARRRPVLDDEDCRAGLCRTLSGLWLVAVAVGLCFAVVLAVLGLHVRMKVQLDAFSGQLDRG